MWNYDEHWVTTVMGPLFASRYQQAGRIIGDDPQYAAWPSRTIFDICNGLTPDASLAKHDAELCQALGLAPSFPPAPTRDALGNVLIGFQGVTAHTTQYGAFPMFGPETTTLNDADLIAYCEDLLDAGFTHGEIAVSWQYAEPGFQMPVPGRDLSNDLPELCRRLRLMLSYLPSGRHLTGVAVFMAGDGRSLPKNPDGTYPYNDPVGHTYGFEWLMDHAPRIWQSIMAAGLKKYCVPVPGYDGVFYGWGNTGEPDLQPQRVAEFGALMRSVDPDVLLFIEHSTGDLPVGGGADDYAPGGLMENYDGVLSEFDAPVTGDQVWQVVARMARPYTRPPDQPAGDDPNPPMYLQDSPRGRRFYVRYEYRTFDWTRGNVTAEQVAHDRAYLQSLAPGPVC